MVQRKGQVARIIHTVPESGDSERALLASRVRRRPTLRPL